MLNRKMPSLTDVPELDRGFLIVAITFGLVGMLAIRRPITAYHEESYRIPRSILRQPLAAFRVSEIAFVQLFR